MLPENTEIKAALAKTFSAMTNYRESSISLLSSIAQFERILKLRTPLSTTLFEFIYHLSMAKSQAASKKLHSGMKSFPEI